MALRRACADEHAVRVNRAVELLADRSSADAVRGLRAEYGLSERQARRYVNGALAPPDGVVVPERTVVFTVVGAVVEICWLELEIEGRRPMPVLTRDETI